MADKLISLQEEIDSGLAAIRHELGEDAFRFLVKVETQKEDAANFEFPLPPDYLGIERTLKIGFRPDFPSTGLRFQIEPSPWLKWPHVMKNSLCLYGAGDEPIVGSAKSVVADKFSRLRELLRLVLDPNAKEDRDENFHREISTYWRQQLQWTNQQLVLLEKPLETCRLYVLSDQRKRAGYGDQRVWLAENQKGFSRNSYTAFGRGQPIKAATAGMFVLLKSVPNVEIPEHHKILSWITPHVSPSDAKKISKWYVDTSGYPVRWLLLALPDTFPPLVQGLVLRSKAMKANGKKIFGKHSERKLRWSRQSAVPPILQAATLHLLAKETVHSRDIANREADLASKCVVMIGAGTLGSSIAAQLLRCGVGQITLIDPDELADANIGRHVLGADDLGRLKVTALKEKFQQDLPLAKVIAIPCFLHEALQDKINLLEDADLVIVTTASWWSEHFLWIQKSREKKWALIQAWTEPYALAGHALIAPRFGKHDARTLFDANGRFLHRFTEWKKQGVIPLPGCGASFIPGGPLSVNAIATMTANAAVSILSGRLKEPQWFSSVSTPKLIAEAGGEYRGPQFDDRFELITYVQDWPEPRGEG